MTTTLSALDQRKNQIRRQVLNGHQYTAIPNWILDDLLRCSGKGVFAYEASHLLLYIIRKTVGYVNSDGTFESSLWEITYDTGISRELVSRYAHAWSYLGFLRYLPSSNSSSVSRFVAFPYGLPKREQITSALSGLGDAVKHMRSNRLSAENFAAFARQSAIKWALKTSPSAERTAEIERLSIAERKGLV
jgi:hypothetical protein